MTSRSLYIARRQVFLDNDKCKYAYRAYFALGRRRSSLISKRFLASDDDGPLKAPHVQKDRSASRDHRTTASLATLSHATAMQVVEAVEAAAADAGAMSLPAAIPSMAIPHVPAIIHFTSASNQPALFLEINTLLLSDDRSPSLYTSASPPRHAC